MSAFVQEFGHSLALPFFGKYLFFIDFFIVSISIYMEIYKYSLLLYIIVISLSLSFFKKQN